jgi:hypothetical protein
MSESFIMTLHQLKLLSSAKSIFGLIVRLVPLHQRDRTLHRSIPPQF